MYKVAVVILNWNGIRFLKDFLPGVVANSAPHKVIIADNASTDGSADFIRTNFPQVGIIENGANLGFTGGYNKALKEIDAEYYVLLNSDIEVTPNWVDPVIALMESDKSIAACQPKILDYKNKQHFEYAGAAGGYIDRLGYPYCRGRIFDTLEEDKGQYNDVVDIFWATGACMFIRAKVFHELGGFDEDFFAHMEEIDICWRIQRAGYRIVFTPESSIYHIGGGTLPKNNARKTYLNFRNNLTMLIKHHPLKRLIWIYPLRLVLDGVAAIKFWLAGGGFKDLKAIAKAHFYIYAHLPSILKKRVSLKTPKNIPALRTKEAKNNIIVNYYLKNKRFFSQH